MSRSVGGLPVLSWEVEVMTPVGLQRVLDLPQPEEEFETITCQVCLNSRKELLVIRYHALFLCLSLLSFQVLVVDTPIWLNGYFGSHLRNHPDDEQVV